MGDLCGLSLIQIADLPLKCLRFVGMLIRSWGLMRQRRLKAGLGQDVPGDF